MLESLQETLLQEKALIEMHCNDFLPLDSEYKVYEGIIFYKLNGRVHNFKVLMEIPTDFPVSPPRFKALQKTKWPRINPATQELQEHFFAGFEFDHVYSYILHFKGEFLTFIRKWNEERQEDKYNLHFSRNKQASDDLSIILRMVKHNSQGQWINKEILMARLGWNLARIKDALQVLEAEGIARKIESRSVGTRWYFPGV